MHIIIAFLKKEFCKEENVELTAAVATSCMKRRLKRFVHCHVFGQ